MFFAAPLAYRLKEKFGKKFPFSFHLWKMLGLIIPYCGRIVKDSHGTASKLSDNLQLTIPLRYSENLQQKIYIEMSKKVVFAAPLGYAL